MASQANLLESPTVAIAVLGASPCAVIDAHEKITETNTAFCELLGQPPAQLAGVPIRKALRAAASDEAASTGEPTFRIRRGQGESWLRMETTRVGALSVVRMVDVGPEWRALGAFAASRSVRDRLMMDAEVGTWRYDPDAQLYYFSDELSLGHQKALKGVPLETLCKIQHPDDVAKDSAIRDRLIAEGG